MQEASGQRSSAVCFRVFPTQGTSDPFAKSRRVKKTALLHSLFRGLAKSGGDAIAVIGVVIVRIAVIVDHTKLIGIAVVGWRQTRTSLDLY